MNSVQEYEGKSEPLYAVDRKVLSPQLTRRVHWRKLTLTTCASINVSNPTFYPASSPKSIFLIPITWHIIIEVSCLGTVNPEPRKSD